MTTYKQQIGQKGEQLAAEYLVRQGMEILERNYHIHGGEADIIAKENGNVIKLEHNQFVSINRNAAVELRITLEAFGTEHKNKIIDTLETNGYKPRVVTTNI